MVDLLDLQALLREIFHQKELLFAVLSDPFQKETPSKISFRPLVIKSKDYYQISQQRSSQIFHRNEESLEALRFLLESLSKYKQAFFYTPSCDYHLLGNKKGTYTLLKKKPSQLKQANAHNRQKSYLLQDQQAPLFLSKLGLANSEGRVYPDKQDKFRQINRFLEMIADILGNFDPSLPLRVVDFGCGKAYLTFALFHFLTAQKGFAVKMIGVDLKEEVIAFCQELAIEIGAEKQLSFEAGSIEAFQPQEAVDLVFALHACNTATDAAIAKAVEMNAKVILVVPCCHQELLRQIKQPILSPLLRHGILKDRLAALATDAIRAELLEAVGYETEVIEFIDLEHTPKNLLIRAVKKERTEKKKESAWRSYLDLKAFLHLAPSLENKLSSLPNNRY